MQLGERRFTKVILFCLGVFHLPVAFIRWTYSEVVTLRRTQNLSGKTEDKINGWYRVMCYSSASSIYIQSLRGDCVRVIHSPSSWDQTSVTKRHCEEPWLSLPWLLSTPFTWYTYRFTWLLPIVVFEDLPFMARDRFQSRKFSQQSRSCSPKADHQQRPPASKAIDCLPWAPFSRPSDLW
jgi:hypothetical protein